MLSSRVQKTLREKATYARKEVARKSELEKNCDNDISNINEHKFDILDFRKYLNDFLTRNTLNDGKIIGSLQKATMIHVRNNEYALLKKKHFNLNIDNDWLQKQNQYVASLSTEDLFNLYGYTHKGDVYVNNYLRGQLDVELFMNDINSFSDFIDEYLYFPLFFPAMRVITSKCKTHKQCAYMFESPPTQDELDTFLQLKDTTISMTDKYDALSTIASQLSFEHFWKVVIQQYVDSLDKIIRGAPRTTHRMVLYRGVKSDYFLSGIKYNNPRDRIYTANNFVSTSSSIQVASNFADFDITNCCFMRMVIPAGTSMILLTGVSAYTESEFLLGRTTKFYIAKTGTEEFCKGSKDRKKRIKVTDIVVV